MKIKKVISIIIAAVSMFVLFAGCKGGTTAEGTLTVVFNEDDETWAYVDTSTNDSIEFKTLTVEGLKVTDAVYSSEDRTILIYFSERPGLTFSIPIGYEDNYALKGDVLDIKNNLFAYAIGES